MADMLAEAGYEVREASNGRDAIESLEAGARPHVILLDMMMPVMSGWEVLKILDLRPGLTDAPVVTISALENLEDHPRVKARMQKPLHPSLVIEVISSLLV